MDTQNLTRLRLEQTWKQARRRLHSNPQQLRLLKLSYSLTVLEFKLLKFIVPILTDTGEDSKLVHKRKRRKVDTLFSSLFSDASERRIWLSAGVPAVGGF